MDSASQAAATPALDVAPQHAAEARGPGMRAAAFSAVAIFASLIYLYAGVLASLARVWWNDPNFSHGFFVPVFAAYLLWTKRRDLQRIEIRPTWWGLAIITGSAAMLIVGTLGAELFLSRCSLVFLLGGLVVFFGGWQLFRELLFPIAFLFLMIPIPAIIFNQITLPLQLLASEIASVVLPFLGVPVLREGNIINLPAMPLEVAEACSGIRSLISLLTLAVAYGWIVERSLSKRILLAIAAVPIAVLANSLRVVGTGLAVQYWNPDRALGFFHEFSGWIIFMVSLFTLLLLHKVMNLRVRAVSSGEQR